MATADEFDPYRKWLGIPLIEQPPNLYRLLGIALFEDDPDVIQNAADRQMKHVRTFQIGKNAAISQRILNELSQARHTLLSPAKEEYDAKLRALMAPAEVEPPPAFALAAAPPLFSAPPPIAEDEGPPAIETSPPVLSIQVGAARPAAAGLRPRMPEQSSGGSSLIWILGGLGAAIAIGGVIYYSTNNSDPHKASAASKGTDTKPQPEKSPKPVTPVKPGEGTRPSKPEDPVRPTTPDGSTGPQKMSLDETLSDARLGLTRRDFDQARRRLSEAKELSRNGNEEVKHRVAHLETLQSYAEGFWNDVRQAIYGLKLTDDSKQPITARFELGRRNYELLKREGEWITYKVNGSEQRSRIVDLPELDALAFSRQHAGERTAAMELSVAAFMLFEFPEGRVRGGGGRDRDGDSAKDHWRRAAELGTRDRALAKELGLESELASTSPAPNPRPVEPRPTPMPSPRPAPKPNRLAVPSPQERNQAETKMVQKYGSDLAAARTDADAKRKLAGSLYRDFLEEAGDPAMRYVSLEKARDLAIELGELEKLVLPFLDEFADTFEIDELLAKATALDRFLMQPAGRGEQAAIVQKIAVEDMPKALREHHFAAALKLSEVSVRAARLAMSKEAGALDRRAKEASQFIGNLDSWEQAAEKGAKKLTLVADDPTASYQVGLFECAGKENWIAGLPHLAKGSDAELKIPAQKELSAPSSAADQLALAQAWADVAKQKRGLAAMHIYKHARVWAQKASLAEGGANSAASLTQEIDMQLARLTKILDDLTAASP